MGNPKVEMSVEDIIYEELDKAIREEIDADFLRELDCVARNWTKVDVVLDFYEYQDAKNWCIEHYPNEWKVFDLHKFYFAKSEYAEWFILRWS